MSEMTDAYVKLDKVSKIYGTKEVKIVAVDEISFEIAKGEFVVIVGPSGAGKTTVLNILGGMDQATSGEVLVDGRNIARYNSRQLTGYRRNDIGFVFQLVSSREFPLPGHWRRIPSSYCVMSLQVHWTTRLVRQS